jgi:integron integrase
MEPAKIYRLNRERPATSPGGPPVNSLAVPHKPKLLDQVRQAIRARHYSPKTEESYVHWIKRFIFFHNKRHPTEMAEKEIAQFLSSLASELHVSASTQNQALNAILFLYRDVLRKEIGYVDGVIRAKRPHRLPVVLTRQEVKSILVALDHSDWLMVMLLYGAGLRLMECLQLRVKDIDFTSNQIIVRAGKGDKDRHTMLPAAVKERLAKHLEIIKEQHQRDIERGLGRVALPNALERKYPNAGKEWGWQWVFPATSHYTDRATGEKHRHHLHESVLQKAGKQAVREAGISKPATPHTFRSAST